MSSLFDSIAPVYDPLNRLFSFGLDKHWRKQVVKILAKTKPKTILDVATGTGDLAIALLQLKPKKITGIDVSKNMLKKAKAKSKKITFQQGDATKLSFKQSQYDAVTVSFGVRNFSDLTKGLTEMKRVLKKNGTLTILEFSKPTAPLFKQFYWCYLNVMIPLLGLFISRKKGAYKHLATSIAQFPQGKQFMSILKEIGFTNIQQKRLTGGICTIYTARK